MAKPYSVAPVLRDGRAFYVATFKTANRKRVCRGLGTGNAHEAQGICDGLKFLWHWLNSPAGVNDASKAPRDLVAAKAIELFFEAPDPSPDEIAKQAALRDSSKTFFAERFQGVPPAELALLAVQLQQENQRIRDLAHGQQLELSRRGRTLDQVTADLEQLKASTVVHLMESAGKAPPIEEAIAEYEKFMATSSPKHARDMVDRARAFQKTVPAGTKMSAISVQAVAAFISEQATRGDPQYKATRYNIWRARLGAFFNFSAKTWTYPSQMTAVKRKDSQLVERERGDIAWHELAEVKAAVEQLPDGYWKALVSTLGFAGLQLAELIWLRASDVKLAADGGRAVLWVTTVEDPEDPLARHELKRANRRRQVDVHPVYLLPLIKAQLAAVPAGGFLFPMPAEVRRSTRELTPGSRDRWRMETLSTRLRGHAGGTKRNRSGKLQRPPQAGLLPAGMNALSLRRTFGSLLLRSGKSVEQVAATMGNTPEVVRKHYARILGHEVDVDF